MYKAVNHALSILKLENLIRNVLNWIFNGCIDSIKWQLLVDNYYVNRCGSHQSADSHQLRGPGDTERLSDSLQNLRHKD